MSAKATNLALSEELVDLNEASATQLQSLLPGIGNVLASRIVAYREENGPFGHPTDLTKVSGIGAGLVSKLSPRISVAPGPTSGYSMRSESPMSMRSDTQMSMPSLSMPAESSEENGYPSMMGGAFAALRDQEMPFPTMLNREENDFFESGEALRSPGAPNLESLLMRGKPAVIKEQEETAEQIQQEQEPETTAEETLFAVQEADYLAGQIIPLHRPWRAWAIGAGIALISATVGSIYGIRSQDGGPLAGLERQAVHTQDQVADLKGSVKNLETQSDSFASSINALDARLTDQERVTGTQQKRPGNPKANETRTTGSAPNRASEVRENVRQALRTLDEVRGETGRSQ
jgi:competence ComEA-like helix-hairpin-helix protein